MRRLDILNALAMTLNQLLSDEHKAAEGNVMNAQVKLDGKQYAVSVRDVSGEKTPKEQADKFLNSKPKVQI
jgi:hypothetical protein